ncbi:MAG: ABC transporter ATP-binding protein [Candidatus Methanofastidiosa archaeon]|nr:ABC transporter ATP-binding protein [Candidatus Methanofastidiosa archaeon]
MSVVEAESLSKWYGEIIGLNSFTAKMGHGITGLVGPNGAGKTTLIRLLSGMIKQGKGDLKVLGMRPFNNPELSSMIGYCPDHENLYFRMKPLTFLHYMARLNGLGTEECRKRSERCLSIVGLSGENRPIGTFSKGMKQRIKIAQALLNDPKLLILDEPFTGVDPVVRANLMDIIRDLSHQGIDVVISSHILYDIERLADDVLLMNDGKMLLSGKIGEIVDIVEDYTHSIIINTSSARTLGSRLFEEGLVDIVDVRSPNELFVRTRDPNSLYDFLPRAVLDEGIAIEKLTPIENDLQSIFERVVGK